MSSTVYAVSEDCPNVIQLAFGLGMQTAQPAIWAQLQGDCCTANDGVNCNGSQRVYEIYWVNIGLNGIINGTAIPSSVIYLHLYNNVIMGNIPLLLPGGLVLLYLHGNQMSGDLPFFPSTLKYLWLGESGNPGNHFTGSLRLNRPIELRINHNWITDVVIQGSNVLATGGYNCDLSNNPLLGNPNIANLTMCTQDGLYSADLLPGLYSAVLLSRSILTLGISTTAIIGEVISRESLQLNPIWTLLKMYKKVIKVVIEAILLIWVINKTPWKREFKSKMEKRKRKVTDNILL